MLTISLNPLLICFLNRQQLDSLIRSRALMHLNHLVLHKSFSLWTVDCSWVSYMASSDFFCRLKWTKNKRFTIPIMFHTLTSKTFDRFRQWEAQCVHFARGYLDNILAADPLIFSDMLLAPSRACTCILLGPECFSTDWVFSLPRLHLFCQYHTPQDRLWLKECLALHVW